MKKSAILQIGFLYLILAACETAPPVETSRQMLWDRFGNQSVDTVLLAWGPPMAETHLTDGTRMINYSRSEIYTDGWVGHAYGCKVSFFASPPGFKINNIDLNGDTFDCHELALGHLGVTSYFQPYGPFVWRPYYNYM